MKENKLVSIFSKIAIAEGISFLVLLLVAMPLKYFANILQPVKYVGWAHGVLFIAFLILAALVGTQLRKNLSWFVKAFIASVVPLGAFVFEKQFKKEQEITGQDKRTDNY